MNVTHLNIFEGRDGLGQDLLDLVQLTQHLANDKSKRPVKKYELELEACLQSCCPRTMRHEKNRIESQFLPSLYHLGDVGNCFEERDQQKGRSSRL